jgi:hypothetical protein
MNPYYPEEHGNRDRTGKLMTDAEIAQLQRIRAKLKQSKPDVIPKNVVIPENVIIETKKKRGKPVNPNSLRQQKLASTEPVVPKRKGRPPKKVIVEETKEETKQEESKEDIAPKKRRGRPIVQGSLRQKKIAEPVVEVKPRGRPKKEEPVKPIITAKVGRPSKCDSVPPKSDVLLPLTHKRPIINWFEIDGARNLGLKSNQHVSEKLLHYNKLTPEAFFYVLDVTIPSVELGNEIRTFYNKNTTRQMLYVTFRKICSYLVAKGLTTARKLEHALVVRIQGDLSERPKELKNFNNFVKKHCIDKQEVATAPKKVIIKKVKR